MLVCQKVSIAGHLKSPHSFTRGIKNIFIALIKYLDQNEIADLGLARSVARLSPTPAEVLPLTQGRTGAQVAELEEISRRHDAQKCAALQNRNLR